MAGLTGGIGGVGVQTSGVGGAGAALTGSGLQFTNSGSITGGAGAITPGFTTQGSTTGGVSSAGGVGLSVASGNAVTLAGTVAGGAGGDGGNESATNQASGGTGGAGGAGLTLTGSLLSFGAGSSITGGTGGNGGSAISTGVTVGEFFGALAGAGAPAALVLFSPATVSRLQPQVRSPAGRAEAGGAATISNNTVAVAGAGGTGGMGLALSGSRLAFTDTGSITGGAGGNGGVATTPSSATELVGGGAGGAGGVGAALSGSGLVFTDFGSINGGTGGNGGAVVSSSNLGSAGGARWHRTYGDRRAIASRWGAVCPAAMGAMAEAVSPKSAAQGGAGGIGISMTSGTLTLGALVRGGNGGTGWRCDRNPAGYHHRCAWWPRRRGRRRAFHGGRHRHDQQRRRGEAARARDRRRGVKGVYPGAPGPSTGGVGITGSNLAIVDAGAITGGLGGDGVTQANAVKFYRWRELADAARRLVHQRQCRRGQRRHRHPWARRQRQCQL